MTATRPTGEVDVCNLALTYLKLGPIASIDDITANGTAQQVAATQCARWYHQTRRQVLRAHTWNFATTRAVLSSSSLTPTFEYTHAFPLPSNWLRFVGRYDATGFFIGASVFEGRSYEIESIIDSGVPKNMLLVNASDNSLSVRYIFDNETVTTWDPLFTDLLAVEMAIKMAPALVTRETNTLARLLEVQKSLMSEARAVDGQERPPRRREHSPLLRNRKVADLGNAGPYTYFD